MNENIEGNRCDMNYFNSLPIVEETDNIRIVEFEEPLVVAVNGKKGVGVVLKPGRTKKETE